MQKSGEQGPAPTTSAKVTTTAVRRGPTAQVSRLCGIACHVEEDWVVSCCMMAWDVVWSSAEILLIPSVLVVSPQEIIERQLGRCSGLQGGSELIVWIYILSGALRLQRSCTSRR
jgi:hypothetical protein